MQEKDNPIVIIATQRSAIGQFQGQFASLSAPQIASAVIQSVLSKSDFSPAEIDEVFMGCVLSAGIGQAPARQAAMGGGIPSSVGCTTINKVCGSGMKAMMLAHDLLLTDRIKVALAGGMESMTNAPYLLKKARQGYRLGHDTLYDHMFLDGLEDAYQKGTLMGAFAEKCAEKYAFTREMQDAFALESVRRAQKAMENGYFNKEIAPIEVEIKNTKTIFDKDELPGKAMPEKIPKLKPAFKENGTITAANSSGISDGACVHLIMRMDEAKRRNLKPLAIIKDHATHSQDPAWFTTAPVGAIQKLLNKVGWNSNDVDLYEINEAFAVVTMAAMKELNLPSEKVNVHGGATVLGHPIGASGARIVTTLIYALQQQGLKRGVAALCIGGGEATAMAIELV